MGLENERTCDNSRLTFCSRFASEGLPRIDSGRNSSGCHLGPSIVWCLEGSYGLRQYLYHSLHSH